MAAGGGAWKVAYADFVTAMMAFFLVMWITAQDDDVKESIAGYFQDPLGTSSDSQRPRSLLPSEMQGDKFGWDAPKSRPPGSHPSHDQQAQSDADLKADTPWTNPNRTHFLQQQERSWPAAVIRFPESTAELDPPSREQLKRLLPAILGKPNKIEIRGHSTRRPLPPDSPYHDHWELCYARSAAVLGFFEANGVEADRLRLSQSGAFEPQSQNLEADWQQENARVEVFLLNEFVDSAPGTSPGRSSTASTH